LTHVSFIEVGLRKFDVTSDDESIVGYDVIMLRVIPWTVNHRR